MGYQVFYSDPKITSQAGFGRVVHLPCILDSRPGYHRLGSEYLIERGVGVWLPFGERPTDPRRAPTAQSIKNYAFWLANFLEWCEVRQIDLCQCSFLNDIQERYQSEMLSGKWSQQGFPLSVSTVNLRIHQACDFLFWMAYKGYRPEFTLPQNKISIKENSSSTSPSQHSDSSQATKSKATPGKSKLRMPTDNKVVDWLNRIYESAGETEGLLCELILVSAMRREEVAAFRVDTIPENPADWDIPNPLAPISEQQVCVQIRYGTKGKCFGYDHGDKIGPAREIKIPLEMAERIHIYRRKVRPIFLKKWIQSAPTLLEKRNRISSSVHLFLNRKSGNRITGRDLYSIWISTPLPIKGWSPHQGRHWWACSILWREFRNHQKLPNSTSHEAPLNFTPFGLNIIRLIIQPQLGHSHENTTLIYLRWFSDMVGNGLSIAYDLDKR